MTTLTIKKARLNYQNTIDLLAMKYNSEALEPLKMLIRVLQDIGHLKDSTQEGNQKVFETPPAMKEAFPVNKVCKHNSL